MNQSALNCIILFYELAITKVIYIYFLRNHVLIKESVSGIIYMALESSLKK